MKIEKNKSLQQYNTFGVNVNASYFVSVNSISELKAALTKKPATKSLFILGGGSNMLLTQDLDAYVIHVNLKGIEILEENEKEVKIKAMAGENWHQFVMYCLEKDYGGIENLSLIPGNIGTAPIQNIGAYGVELKDVFVACTTISVDTLEEKVYTKDDVDFGYRDSIFKNELKGKVVITDVTLKLSKAPHRINTTYGAIQAVLEDSNITTPGIRAISDAVIQIRQSKLPDPKTLGNSGSFFKNPIVDKQTFEKFIEKFPEAPFYKITEEAYKIPAGWLIEKTGFKGSRFGDAGVHEHQALVLVNYGNATGKEIRDLAFKIQETVKEKTGISIEPEVNIF